MRKFMSYKEAKKLRDELTNYIELIDDYKVTNLDTWIIKNYALTNSIAGVIKNARIEVDRSEPYLVNHQSIAETIRKSPSDDLHNIVRKGYQNVFGK